MVLGAFLTMRPLHRPVHVKFIFSKDWDKMSEEEQKKAINEGKIRLPSQGEFRKMKKDEITEWSKTMKPYIEEIKDSFISLLRKLPHGLLLVCRYRT